MSNIEFETPRDFGMLSGSLRGTGITMPRPADPHAKLGQIRTVAFGSETEWRKNLPSDRKGPKQVRRLRRAVQPAKALNDGHPLMGPHSTD